MTLQKYILSEITRSESNWYCRFIHKNLDKNELPLQWFYPPNNVFEGAQVLNVLKAINMVITKNDPLDDWFYYNEYHYLSFLNVTGTSGESELGYKAIIPSDIKKMYVIPLDDVIEYVYETIIKLEDEINVDTSFPISEEWAFDLGINELNYFIEVLLNNHGEKVTPKFIDTI